MIRKLFGKTKGNSPQETPEKNAPQGREHSRKSSDSKNVKGASVKSEGRAKKNTSHKKQHSQSHKAKPKEPWTLDKFPVPVVADKVRFHDLDLPLDIMHGIADLGFEYCSPIQAQSLPQALDGYDVVGKAQTGTGKTAAFLVTILTDILENPIESGRYVGEPRALIIAPTRELVIQIAKDAELLAKHTDIKLLTLVGGMDYTKQLNTLNKSLIDIVIATPGRLMDFQSRGDVHLDQVEILVIDEADRMLDMGFIPQVRSIVRCTPRKTDRQTLFFSATFTPAVIELTEQWTMEPKIIEIEPDRVANDSVTQIVYLVSSDDKFKLLFNIVEQDNAESVIVFANRRDETRRLQEKLKRQGIRCGLLSGEVPQNKRVKTLEDFKTGNFQVLVATDVAGRGIHVDGISHVINFTLPEDPEDYVHRIGRTGRAGATGTSISFACEDDSFLLPAIEELLGNKLSCEQPSDELMADLPRSNRRS